ncbi:Chaperone for protein-folding within the ER, fungal family protein [Candida albicans]|uniref:Protein ROT1 n=1 Tax=Candida albicans TaxID=5476 RepID=A0A8H6C1V6_CANAX|nr:Chaperone for protein-folding within the ER, fungal family protein [Candida albicans]
MYTILIPSLLYIALTIASSELLNSIQGTWQSQSERVITGPTFFDPQKELLEEPKLPGISYSFKNGYWESAQYIVMGNNRNHQCPQAMLIWQHGKYNLKEENLCLFPIEMTVDN